MDLRAGEGIVRFPNPLYEVGESAIAAAATAAAAAADKNVRCRELRLSAVGAAAAV